MNKAELKRLQNELFPQFLHPSERESQKPVASNMYEAVEGGGAFDLNAIVSDLIDPKTGKMRELVDTRSLPKAKNFYDYCFRILGSDIHAPWSVQMWLAVMTLGEVCPRCTNPKYKDIHKISKRLDSKKLNSPKRMTFLEDGVCPRCGATKRELLASGELAPYNQGVFVLGQRSGKSSTAAVIASYVLHSYLTYPILSSMTNSMQASTELVMIFCSLSYDKAKSVLWTPFKKIVDNSQWFKSYFALLDQYQRVNGVELYRSQSEQLAFAHKNIRCFPTGPKASALRGNTSMMTLLDELGLFPLPDPTRHVEEDDTNRRADSDEAYTSLLNSLATVGAAQKELIEHGHFDAPPCLMLSVSSPISKRDKVMRLLEEAKTNPYIFGAQLATWEVNPFLEKDSPLIASAFKADQRKALRDFGAVPTETSSPYFDANVVPKIFCGRPNSHLLTYNYDASHTHVWGTVRQVNSYNGPTVMALDAGLVNNSFAIAVVGYDNVRNRTETVCLLEVMANDGLMIDFEHIYTHTILPLAEQLNVCYVVADRWNSADHLHRIRNDRGVRNKKPVTFSKSYSLKPRDFEAVRSMMANGTVTCPKIGEQFKSKILSGTIGDYKQELIEHPVEHFMLQLLTVTDFGAKMCPGKAEGFTDDLVRAWVLAVAILNKEKVMEWLNSVRPFVTRSSATGGIGVFIGHRSF